MTTYEFIKNYVYYGSNQEMHYKCFTGKEIKEALLSIDKFNDYLLVLESSYLAISGDNIKKLIDEYVNNNWSLSDDGLYYLTLNHEDGSIMIIKKFKKRKRG